MAGDLSRKDAGTRCLHPKRAVRRGRSGLFPQDGLYMVPRSRPPERCQSGRLGRSRKPVCVQAYRGFESHPLRQQRLAKSVNHRRRASLSSPRSLWLKDGARWRETDAKGISVEGSDSIRLMLQRFVVTGRRIRDRDLELLAYCEAELEGVLPRFHSRGGGMLSRRPDKALLATTPQVLTIHRDPPVEVRPSGRHLSPRPPSSSSDHPTPRVRSPLVLHL